MKLQVQLNLEPQHPYMILRLPKYTYQEYTVRIDYAGQVKK